MKTVAFFNNKGGVGKTSLVYHLAWMFSELGKTVLAVDLDPQANLTSMFLKEDRLESLWGGAGAGTIFTSIEPLMNRTGDLGATPVECISKRIHLIPGDLSLSRFEDLLSENWTKIRDNDEGAFRIMSSFHRVILQGAQKVDANLVLIDVGPNLGAINRAALIASEHLVVPLAPDLFSLQGLRNLGPTLREWRKGWRRRLEEAGKIGFPLPQGLMQPAGYVVMQHGVRDSRPVKAYQKWMDRVPEEYRTAVLDEAKNSQLSSTQAVANDPNKIAQLKHYRSLMPLAMEARKPMFFLKPADGAMGAHVEAVNKCYSDFKNLAEKVAQIIGLSTSGEDTL